MATPRLELSSAARRAYEKLHRADRKLFERVDRALDRIIEDPQCGKPLQGPLAGRCSLRVGQIRIVYRFEHDRLLIFVLDIAQRGEVYR